MWIRCSVSVYTFYINHIIGVFMKSYNQRMNNEVIIILKLL